MVELISSDIREKFEDAAIWRHWIWTERGKYQIHLLCLNMVGAEYQTPKEKLLQTCGIANVHYGTYYFEMLFRYARGNDV